MTREKAIDIIKAERECVCRQGRTGECCRDDLGCGACDLVQEDVDIIEAYDMAIEALKERPHGEWKTESAIDYLTEIGWLPAHDRILTERPQWIPCSERLPEKSGQYYVSGGDKVWLCDFLIIPTFKGGWCNNVSNPVVEAWMPLPEPYKRGEAE